MTLREVVIALVFGAIGAISAIVFFGPWSPIGQALYKGHMLREDLRKKDWRKHHPNIVSPRAQAAIQAYTKIERTLRRGSIER